jgi:phospholipase/lecithinase/hemolysin
VWTKYFEEKLGVEVDSLAYGGAMTGEYPSPIGPVSNYNSFAYGLGPLPGVQYEVNLLLAEDQHLNPQALYVIWAGANDFFLGLDLQNLNFASLDSILAQALKNIADTVCELGKAGARHFAVANLPDIGLSPFATIQGPEASQWISLKTAQFNRDLRKTLAALPKGCAKTVVILDTFRFLRQIVRHPEAYGLENVTEPCLTWTDSVPSICAEPDKYLFWDTAHPTTAAHALLADRFVAEFCGCNLRYQFWGRHGHWGVKPPSVWRHICYGAR